MKKLGGLSDLEKKSLSKSVLTDEDACRIIGDTTALYLRFKSIKLIEINFCDEVLHIYFSSFKIRIKYEKGGTLEALYRKVEDDIIIKAMQGLL